MSANMSLYLKNALINHTFRNTPFSTPGADIWLSLHSGDPGLTGANEVSGGTYERLQVSTWDAPSLRSTRNTNNATFTTLTADLGVATHLGVWDAQISGNFLFRSDPFTLPLTIGSAPQFQSGNIVVSILGNSSDYLAAAWINHVFRNTAFTTPGTNLYVALFNGNPGSSGASEIVGNNYAREQVSDWGAPSSGVSRNASNIQFNTPSGNWGSISGTGVFDASSSGNYLGGVLVTSQYAAQMGDTNISFGAGELVLVAE